MDRVERLVNLLAALIETPRPLTRDAIRQRVPGYSEDDAASRRAFERDKETLRSMGVALITEPIDPVYPEQGEGYRVPPEKYWLPDPGLTREEIDALALAASATKLSDGGALWKLGAGTTNDSAIKLDLDMADKDKDKLTQLFTARSEYREVAFTYKSKERTLQPHRLSFRSGHWYVNGFDLAHEDIRTYRIERIESDLTLSEPDAFKPPEPTQMPWLPPWQLGDEVPVVAQILIDADQANLVIEQTGEQGIVERRDDGSVIIELTVTNRDGLRSFVLGLLDHAEILGPQELRNEFIDYLQALVTS